MESDYGTEVRLLARTQLSVQTPAGEVSGLIGGSLIEMAGRLCYDTVDKLDSRPGWVGDRIKSGHESIIEHESMSFYIRCSRVVTHELVRHRLASYSQRSQRFVDESEPRYITPPELDGDNWMSNRYRHIMGDLWVFYRKLLELGVKPEIARYVLPNACETQIIMTMNLRELRLFLRLRTSPRALPEMREVACKVRDICKEWYPEVFEDM